MKTKKIADMFLGIMTAVIAIAFVCLMGYGIHYERLKDERMKAAAPECFVVEGKEYVNKLLTTRQYVYVRNINSGYVHQIDDQSLYYRVNVGDRIYVKIRDSHSKNVFTPYRDVIVGIRSK